MTVDGIHLSSPNLEGLRINKVLLEKIMNTVFLGLIVILSTAGLFALASIVNGYVLSVLWKWFIVPVFGVTPISIPVAIGIALVVSFLTHKTSYTRNEKDKKSDLPTPASFGSIFLFPTFALLFGWIVQMFM